MGSETHPGSWICVYKLRNATTASTTLVSAEQSVINIETKVQKVKEMEGSCCTDFPCYDTTAPLFSSSAAHIAFGCPVSDCLLSLLLYHSWVGSTHTNIHLQTLVQVLNQAIRLTVAIVTAATLSPSDNLLHIKNLLSTTDSTLPHMYTRTENHTVGYFDSRNKWHMPYFALAISGREGKGRISIHFHPCFSLLLYQQQGEEHRPVPAFLPTTL